MKLFSRFLVDLQISREELWWTDIKDGSRQWHLFDISIIERSFDERSYKGLQLIVLNLSVCIADIRSCKNASNNPGST